MRRILAQAMQQAQTTRIYIYLTRPPDELLQAEVTLPPPMNLKQIRRLAMFSDDELTERLVSMAAMHSRSSIA